MDNISEARTEVESIVAPPSNVSANSSVVAKSISQEPIFGGDDENGEVNVSFAFFILFTLLFYSFLKRFAWILKKWFVWIDWNHQKNTILMNFWKKIVKIKKKWIKLNCREFL